MTCDSFYSDFNAYNSFINHISCLTVDCLKIITNLSLVLHKAINVETVKIILVMVCDKSSLKIVLLQVSSWLKRVWSLRVLADHPTLQIEPRKQFETYETNMRNFYDTPIWITRKNKQRCKTFEYVQKSC